MTQDRPVVKALLFDADGALQRPGVRRREALMPILGAADIADVAPFPRDVLETESAHLCAPSGLDAALMETPTRWDCSKRFAETTQALNAIRIYDDVNGVVHGLRQAGLACRIASLFIDDRAESADAPGSRAA